MNIMKKLLIFLVIPLLFVGCKKDDPERKWIETYSNVIIGAQNNTSIGHFFKPQTGQVVAVENTVGLEKYLALMFYTSSYGNNPAITFPADRGSSTVPIDNNRLFTQNPGGVDSWPASSLVAGMIDICDMTTADFDNLKSTVSWEKFNKAFSDNNNNDESLTYKKGYVLTPQVGEVFLTQFNGLVRAIICIRTVFSSGTNSTIKFDMIIEGRESYANSISTQYLQPLEK
jgi:hypothetical protein